MFALKRAYVACNVANRLSGIRLTPVANTFVTNVNKNQIKKEYNEQYSYPSITSLFPYMKPELENGTEYMDIFPDFIREITDYSKFTSKPNNFKDAEEHFIKMLDYNVSDGHRDFLFIMTDMYKDLMGDRLTKENLQLAHILGWALELNMSGQLIIDDMNDHAFKRRNKPTWCRVEGMKNIAQHDAIMLENSCYLIINRFFSHLPCHFGMIEALVESGVISLWGQLLELKLNKPGLRNNFERYTVAEHNNIVTMACSYYRFYMPGACIMLYAGYDLKKDEHLFDAIKIISHEAGPYFQVQNDFFDCFGGPNYSLNKPSMDVGYGKLSWCIGAAMEHGNEQQKDVLRKNYGNPDKECVAKVMQVYRDIGLPEIFKDYRKRSHKKMNQLIDELLESDPVLKKASVRFFNQVFT